MRKLTVHTNRKQTGLEYSMVVKKTQQYEVMEELADKSNLTEQNCIDICKWFTRVFKIKRRKLLVTFSYRGHGNGWASTKYNFEKNRCEWWVKLSMKAGKNGNNMRIETVLHECAHIHNYEHFSGSDHDDGFIRTLDTILWKFNISRDKKIKEIKEKYEVKRIFEN